MKITDRMCNVVWGSRGAFSEGWYRYNTDAQNIGTKWFYGVFKEHSQPMTDSDYSVPGYCTLSISYNDFYACMSNSDNRKNSTVQLDAKALLSGTIEIVYGKDRRVRDPFYRQVRFFAVRAVTMARNYRTYEVDHVVLTLEELNAAGANGSN